MLDWSSSPLVALHFAVDEEELMDKDGIIWCINPNELSVVDVPSDFSAGEGIRYQLYTSDQLDQKIQKATLRKNQDIGKLDPHFIPNMKRDITTILEDLDGFCSGDHPFVMFLDPPSDKRISNQATIYSIMASPTAVFDDWLERSPHGCFKVILNAQLKREVRDKLTQANVNDRLLIPGLEGLGKWLKKYYTPRYPSASIPLTLKSPPSIQTVTPTSWENLLDLLFSNELTWNDELRMHRSKYVFRGLPSDKFTLTTSLQLTSKADMKHCRSIEEHIIRNFQRYAHTYATDMHQNIFNWLSLAQHNGIPTRLLDWSQSPLVALYFATIYAQYDSQDGVIVCINPTLCSEYIPLNMRDEKRNFNVFSAEQLEMRIRCSDHFVLSALKGVNLQVSSTRPVAIMDLEHLSNDPFVVFLEPPSLDERIINQCALFSILSKPDMLMDDWIARYPQVCRRIVIPAKMKSEIRDKLDHSNMNEKVMFPGVDGIAQFLGRYYTFRPKI